MRCCGASPPDTPWVPRPLWPRGWSTWGVQRRQLYALNATTGALLWSFTAGGFVYSSPAAADGVVYVGSYNGNVYALGLANEDT